MRCRSIKLQRPNRRCEHAILRTICSLAANKCGGVCWESGKHSRPRASQARSERRLALFRPGFPLQQSGSVLRLRGSEPRVSLGTISVRGSGWCEATHPASRTPEDPTCPAALVPTSPAPEPNRPRSSPRSMASEPPMDRYRWSTRRLGRDAKPNNGVFQTGLQGREMR